MAIVARSEITIVNLHDGNSTRTYIAYADSPNGLVNFSLEPGDRKYMGIFTDVDRDDLQAAVDAPVVEGDGRNLIFDSSRNIGDGVSYRLPMALGSEAGLRIGAGATETFKSQPLFSGPVVLSFRLKGTLPRGLNFYEIATSGNRASWIFRPGTNNFEDFTFFSKTVNLKESIFAIYLATGYSTTSYLRGYEIQSSTLKLELGAIATPWSPAPEDVLADFDAKRSTAASYQWSLIAGADGVSISSVVIQYAKHTSGLVVPPEGYVKTPEPLVNGSYLVTNALWGIRFVADNDITIHSFDIYAKTTGSVTLQLRNLGASPITTLFEKTVAVLPGRNTVVFEQSIVAGTYWLGPVTTSVNLYRTSEGLAYPYNSGTFRILSRTNSEGLNENTTSGYYYIYNLLVSGEGVTPQAGRSIWADPPAPVWEKDKYIWQRTKITFSNGTIAYVGVQCIESDMATKIVAHHESDLTPHSLQFTEVWNAVDATDIIVGVHSTSISNLSAKELVISETLYTGGVNLLKNPTFGTPSMAEKTGWTTG